MAITPIAIVAYLLLFLAVGVVFLFVALLLGRFLRPHTPSPQKMETYECGEIAVGPSFLQYDLRFYVVALLFIIFEVEVALFFPPAVVFGTVNQLRSQVSEHRVVSTPSDRHNSVRVDEPPAPLPSDFRQSLRRLGFSESSASVAAPLSAFSEPLRKLALAVIVDLGVFFAVLLVGFAYLWHRGDIAWIRPKIEQRGVAG